MSQEQDKKEGVRGRSKAQWSWETPPESIAASAIKKTITSDIVVIGAGLSGVTAAMAAAETGASVTVLEKGSTVGPPRHAQFFFNSRVMKAEGIELDLDAAIFEFMKETGLVNVDQSVVRTYVYKSGEVVDWLTDILADASIQVTLMSAEQGNSLKYLAYWPHYPTGHLFGFPGRNYMAVFMKYAQNKGAEFRFKTPGVRLIKGENGRVNSVIGRNADGDYLQFNARKGVILSTGGFGRDPEMMERYVPLSDCFAWNFSEKTCTGDGHKMAMWVGADMDEVSSGYLFGGNSPVKSLHPLAGWAYYPAVAALPMLYVNKAGNRCMNEEVNLFCMNSGNAFLNQPGGIVWSVWDSRWESRLPPAEYLGEGVFATNTQQQLEKDLTEGITLKAATIEELAGKTNIPLDGLQSTIARYNELCKGGKDVDYLKSPAWMARIDTPPYYAARIGASICGTTGGVKINDKLQALDKDAMVIPGLYATGDAAGSFVGYNLVYTFAGIGAGPALTHGYVAAKNALRE